MDGFLWNLELMCIGIHVPLRINFNNIAQYQTWGGSAFVIAAPTLWNTLSWTSGTLQHFTPLKQLFFLVSVLILYCFFKNNIAFNDTDTDNDNENDNDILYWSLGEIVGQLLDSTCIPANTSSQSC